MKKKRILFIFLITLFFIIQIPNISADTKTVELIAIEDSYVDIYDPDDNYGASNYLWVWEIINDSSSDYGDRTYLKFDLSSIPNSAKITSVELNLYLQFKNSETCSIGAYYCSNNNWNELNITWNNAPSFEDSAIDICYEIAFEGWYSWNVTSAVSRVLSNNMLTLVLNKVNATDISSFYSKDRDYSWEEDNRPRLTITYNYEQSNTSLSADYSYSPLNPSVDDTIQFTDTSYDPDGTISSWSWNFGDGAGSTIKNPTHKFSTSETYTVTLEVTDDDGATDLFSKNILVEKSKAKDTTNNDNGIPGFEFITILVVLSLLCLISRRRK